MVLAQMGGRTISTPAIFTNQGLGAGSIADIDVGGYRDRVRDLLPDRERQDQVFHDYQSQVSFVVTALQRQIADEQQESQEPVSA